MHGVKVYPVSETCSDRARRIQSHPKCISAFINCCEFANRLREEEPNKLLILARKRKQKSFDPCVDMQRHSRLYQSVNKCRGDNLVNLFALSDYFFQKELCQSPQTLICYPYRGVREQFFVLIGLLESYILFIHVQNKQKCVDHVKRMLV